MGLLSRGRPSGHDRDGRSPAGPQPLLTLSHSLASAVAWIECVVDAVHEAGDHDTVVLGWGDMERRDISAVPDSAEAYVIDDAGYSVKRVGRVENIGRWGGVPLWWLAGFPTAFVAFVVMAFSGWLETDTDADADA